MTAAMRASLIDRCAYAILAEAPHLTHRLAVTCAIALVDAGWRPTTEGN